MSVKTKALAAAVTLALCGTGVQARDFSDIFTLRGYGTLGVVHSDEHHADFVSAILIQPEGAGYSDEWSTAVDSRNALQIDMTFSDRLSGVVQLISEGASNNSWDGDTNKRFFPSLEWANLSYRVSDELTVRVGRIVQPFSMSSEYRKVGFANHWVRPPVEVYGAQPFTSSDGGDVTYRSKVAGATNTVRAHYGVQALRNATFKAQVKLWGINDAVEMGALTVRAAYMHTEFAAPGATFEPLFAPFIAAAGSIPGGQSAAQEATRLLRVYDPSGDQSFELYGAGLSYDPGDWFVMSEAVSLKSGGLLLDTTSGYVSGGYRIGKLTPYLTYARTRTELREEPGVPLAGLPPQLAGLGAVINGAVAGLAGSDSSQQTFAVGMRWDVASAIALKAQYDYIDLASGSPGMLANPQPEFQRGGDLNVLSLTLDFVF
jgi:opacity protein-like surface antigen